MTVFKCAIGYHHHTQITDRPIRYRDRIAVTGFEGTVVQVDLRYTVLEREGQRILIPNAVLFTNPITITSSTQEVGVGEQRDTDPA